MATGLSACVDQKPKSLTEKTSTTSTTSAATSAAASATAACTIFSSNSYDFSICKSCVTSTGSTDITTLAQCVHTNSGPGGGAACVGLVCGAGQIANFATCSCQDALPTTTFGTQPGQEDVLTPIISAGLNIGNRTCPLTPQNTGVYQCHMPDTVGSFLPKNLTTPPDNVFVDTDYLRWDLSLDNSQFPTYVTTIPSINTQQSNLQYNYTYSTLAGSLSFAYNLKPTTAISSTSNTVKVCDCAEHFSSSSATSGATEINSCFTNVTTGACAAGTTYSQALPTATTSGAFVFPPLSMNGPASNMNLTMVASSAKTMSDYLRLGVGVGKADNSNPVSVSQGSGLFSNIGTYKYSLGPFVTTKTGSTTTQNITTVTKRMSINMNLGYSPVSSIESSAFAPNTIANQVVTTRTCSDASDPCVLSTVYRTSGGAIAYQAFSPQYPGHASTVSTLPSGVTAVSTPKIIEDDSQIKTSETTKAPKLRVFTRGSDGNIYMSKGFLGVWSSWMNLGRPWIASTAGVPASISSQAPIYWNYTGATTTAQNDGISIAGEPMVSSYTEPAATTPDGDYNRTYVIVMARVSHFKPDGSLGIFHNSVFYTLGVSYGSSSSQSLDTATNWTPWTPIKDNFGAIMQIQGNPLVFLNTKAGVPAAHFFATKLAGKTMSGESYNAHPPLAPLNSPNTLNGGTSYIGLQCSAFSNAACGYKNGVRNWFSYGSSLVHGYVNFNATRWASPNATLDDAKGIFGCSAGACLALMTTTAMTTEASLTGVVASDWTGYEMKAVAFAVSPGNRVRVYANVLNGFNTATDATCSTVDYKSPMQDAIFTGVDCGFPQARTSLVVYEFIYGAAMTNALVAQGYGVNFFMLPKTNLIGNPNAVSLVAPGADVTVAANTFTPTGGVKTTSIVDPVGSLQDTSRSRVLILGRYVTKSTRVLPPTFYYIVSTEQIGGANDQLYTTYKPFEDTFASEKASTEYVNMGSGFNSSSVYTSAFFPTSDIMGFYSNGLKNIKSDVPVYLFARDSNGKLAFGYWNSTNDATIGPKLFSFRSVGVFTN